MLSSRYSKYQVGNPVCEAGLVIHKDGKTTNSGHTCQKFCCPFRQSKTGCYPCNHKSWNNGRKNRGCMKYKTILSDYRFSIDRDAYNLSASMPCMLSVKRYKSRFKVFGQERLWVRNGTSSAKLNSFSHISALAIAPVTVLSASHSYRSGKQLRLICHTHIYFQAQFISGLDSCAFRALHRVPRTDKLSKRLFYPPLFCSSLFHSQINREAFKLNSLV